MKAVWFIARIVISLALCFGLCCGALVMDGLRDELARSDVGIVLGSKIEPDGTPSARLKARLDRAAQLYKQGWFPAIIVSGGTGEEGFNEPLVMRAYLISQGVPATAIITDSAGVNTRATARNSAVLMQDRRMASAMVITQYFHISRTRMAMRQAGVPEVACAHPDFFEWRDLYSIPREVVGFVAYAMDRRVTRWSEPSRLPDRASGVSK